MSFIEPMVGQFSGLRLIRHERNCGVIAAVALYARKVLEDDKGGRRGLYEQLGMPKDAIDFYTKALAVSRETRDRGLEGNILNNLGNASADANNMHAATDYYRQAESGSWYPILLPLIAVAVPLSDFMAGDGKDECQHKGH